MIIIPVLFLILFIAERDATFIMKDVVEGKSKRYFWEMKKRRPWSRLWVTIRKL